MYEELRMHYKPCNVRVLFIGESRPANGTFFYCQDSILYKETKQVFDTLIGVDFDCQTFKQYHCWLYDVCDVPVNHLSRAERRAQVRLGIPNLLTIISDLNPDYVVVTKRTNFAEYLRAPLTEVGYEESRGVVYLPFPAFGNQNRYREGLKSVLEKIM